MSEEPPSGRSYLLLDDARSFGGGQRFALRLARHLATEHPKVPLRIACPAGSRLAAACEAEGIPHLGMRFPAPRPVNAPALAAAAVRVRRLLTKSPPGEVVIANSARAQAILALAAPTLGARPPIVNFMHEQDSAGRRSARWVHRRLGALVVVGSNSARAYADRLSGVPVGRTNNFLLPSEYERLATHRTAHRAPPVVGVLARLIPEKGILELVRELAAHPGTWSELRVAGGFQDPGYARCVEACGAELGVGDRVRLLGERDDVAAFLAQIDVLAVPSVGREGQPTVVLEALAAGVPAVVRRGGFSEDFAGLPVRSYATADELASALRRPPASTASIADLTRRFGPEQAIAAIEAAARRP